MDKIDWSKIDVSSYEEIQSLNGSYFLAGFAVGVLIMVLINLVVT